MGGLSCAESSCRCLQSGQNVWDPGHQDAAAPVPLAPRPWEILFIQSLSIKLVW